MSEELFARAPERIKIALEAAYLIEGLLPLMAEAADQSGDFAARGMLAAVRSANNATMRMLNACGERETSDEVESAINLARYDLCLINPNTGSGHV